MYWVLVGYCLLAFLLLSVSEVLGGILLLAGTLAFYGAFLFGDKNG